MNAEVWKENFFGNIRFELLKGNGADNTTIYISYKRL
jgi:hypothetical protein